MSCNYPITAYRVGEDRRSKEIVFHATKGMNIQSEFKVPCGRCYGCKEEKARQWLVRCVHESKMHEHNTFVTLTFSEENIPDREEIDYSYFQRFMKRLRKRFKEKRIGFYMCGEYGENSTKRPHFHALLFNIDFEDKKFFKRTSEGNILYTSEVLDKCWTEKKSKLGFATLGAVLPESVAYVVGYIKKKQYSMVPETHYGLDKETGVVFVKQRELSRMSLKPGIGKRFYDKYKDEIFPQDRCVIGGKEIKPPKYYYLKLKEENKNMAGDVADRREAAAVRKRKDNTEKRLMAKEKCLEAKANLKLRDIGGQR